MPGIKKDFFFLYILFNSYTEKRKQSLSHYRMSHHITL